MTGAGVISPLGNDLDTFYESVRNGVCGIKTCTRIDTSDLPTKVAATVDVFDPTDYMEVKESRRMDRYAHFAVAAATQAVKNAGLDVTRVDADRMGVIVGSGVGGVDTFEKQHNIYLEKGFKRVSPFFLTMMIADSAAGLIAIKFGAKGINECIVNSCASSTSAIGEAFRTIRDGYADIIITGGSEACITPMAFAAFCAAGRSMSVNEDPSKACRPFDKQRDGFVMGEGAGMLVLESMEHAVSRNAPIIVEIAGYGSSCDAYHITAPDPEGGGFIKCMENALVDAGMDISQIDYINAHGTSTPLNDKAESQAIRKVFKEYTGNLSVSSTKSMTGHLLGAAGAIEAIITAYAIQNNFLPPTIGYEIPDPECDLPDYVPNMGRNKMVRAALTNGFGFGGHNACLVLKKCNGD